MEPTMSRWLPRLLATAVTVFARIVTGVRPDWRGCVPEPRQRVYFANHASHGDFVLIWTVLPPTLREITRPVAGSDYWLKGAVRRYVGERVFRAVLIDRVAAAREQDPIAVMGAAIDTGNSLIVFPEGTRNTTDAPLLPFRSGIYRLALVRPGIEFVPVWIDNISRVMPKGELLPIPLLCSVTFGTPLTLGEGEDKDSFLDRARSTLLALSPAERRRSE
jgi:1-acyl-sn-glycerol-3-phosphate acyltransferase